MFINISLLVFPRFQEKQWSKNEQIPCEYYTDGLPWGQRGEAHNGKIDKRMGYEQCERVLPDKYDRTMTYEGGAGQRRIKKTAQVIESNNTAICE